MEYELAKKLKDAGFPQKTALTHVGQEIGISEPDGSDFVFTPTLSELIESCGDRFYSLIYPGGKDWICYSAKSDDYFVTAKGAIPEEAVANLWLELNKK